jgi:hypothetical protein
MANAILYIAFGGSLTQSEIRAIVEPALRSAGLAPGATTYAQVTAQSAPAFTFDPSRNQQAALAAAYGADWRDRDDIAIPTVRSGTGVFATSSPFTGDLIERVNTWTASADGNSYVHEPMGSDVRGGTIQISAYKQMFSGVSPTDPTRVSRADVARAIEAIDNQMGGLPTGNGAYFRLSVAPVGRALRGDHGVPPNPGASSGGVAVAIGVMLVLGAGAAYVATRQG